MELYLKLFITKLLVDALVFTLLFLKSKTRTKYTWTKVEIKSIQLQTKIHTNYAAQNQ